MVTPSGCQAARLRGRKSGFARLPGRKTRRSVFGRQSPRRVSLTCCIAQMPTGKPCAVPAPTHSTTPRNPARIPVVQGCHLGAACTAPSATGPATGPVLHRRCAGLPTVPRCDPGAQDRFYEAARARAVGVLVLDVASGRIEQAASAHTPCYAADQLGASEANLAAPSGPPAITPRRPLFGWAIRP